MEVIITAIAAIIFIVCLTCYVVNITIKVLSDLASNHGPWYASLAFLLFLSSITFISYIT